MRGRTLRDRWAWAAASLFAASLGVQAVLSATSPVQALPGSAEAEVRPGTRFPAQRLAYRDPLTGREGWRLTTMGKEHGMNVVLGGDRAQENTQWSPDGRWITFSVDLGSRAFPTGVYLLEVRTGAITFLAPSGHDAEDSVFNPANPREVLYVYHGGEGGSRWIELRAVDIRTCRTRAIRRLGRAWGSTLLTVSANGRWAALVALTGDPNAHYTQWIGQQVLINLRTGREHPDFRFDPDLPYTPGLSSFDDAADGIYWNPKHADWAWLQRPVNGRLERAYMNVETGEWRASYHGTAHTALHPNGEWHAGDWGVRDTHNKCLGKECGQQTPYRTWGHPFANPADGERGMEARIITDDVLTYHGRIQEITFETVCQRAWRSYHDTMEFVVGTTFGVPEPNRAHPHVQYSPDGRWIAWHSNLRQTNVPAAPGPDDGQKHTTDLFLLKLR